MTLATVYRIGKIGKTEGSHISWKRMVERSKALEASGMSMAVSMVMAAQFFCFLKERDGKPRSCNSTIDGAQVDYLTRKRARKRGGCKLDRRDGSHLTAAPNPAKPQ